MLSKEIKVGAFVLTGLIVVGLVIFLIGDSRHLFERKAEFQAVFDDVEGLGRGSPVRMGGVDIGSVTKVRYATDSKDNKVYVNLGVTNDGASRIREDSVATISSKGLLGDKMVVISVGNSEARPLTPGSTIKSTPAQDLGEMMSKLSNIGAKVEIVLDNLQKATDAVADDGFRNDVRAGASSLRKILDSAANGQGYVGRVLNDPAEADRLSKTIANLEKSSADLDRVFAGVTLAMDRVNQGPGLAHELIYGEKAADAINNVGEAADEAAILLKGLREQGGDRELARILADLGQVTSDLKTVSQNLREGKGTLGALLIDPSVYEDVKLLLGNVQRNDALRALVRYSIKRDETAPATAVTDPRAGGMTTDSRQ